MKKNSEIILLILVFIATFFSFRFNVGSLMYIVYFIIFFRVFFSTTEKNIYLILFLLPNFRMFDGTGISFLANSVFILVLIKYFVEYKGKFPKIILMFSLLFLIYELSHFFITNDIILYFDMLSWISSFFIAGVALVDKRLRIRVDKLFWYLALGILFSAVIVLFTDSTFYTLEFLNIRSYRLEGLAGDPNYFAMYILIAIFSIVNLPKKNIKSIVLQVIFFILLGGIGFLTLSKMYTILFVSLIVVTIIYGLIFYNKNNKKRTYIIILVFFSLVFILILLPYFELIIEKILGRFNFNENAEGIIALNSITSGRTDINIYYLEQFSNNIQNFLVGLGREYRLVIDFQKVAHNTYLDILMSWGVIGTILFLYSYFKIYMIYIKNSKKKDILSKLPVLIMLISLFSLSAFSADMFFIVILFCIIQTRKKDVI